MFLSHGLFPLNDIFDGAQTSTTHRSRVPREGEGAATLLPAHPHHRHLHPPKSPEEAPSSWAVHRSTRQTPTALPSLLFRGPAPSNGLRAPLGSAHAPEADVVAQGCPGAHRMVVGAGICPLPGPCRLAPHQEKSQCS